MRKPGRTRVISATSAAKTFGALIEHVRTDRAEYIVERGGAPAVRIVSAAARPRCSAGELVELLRSMSRADESYLKAVEAGMGALNRPAVPVNRWES